MMDGANTVANWETAKPPTTQGSTTGRKDWSQVSPSQACTHRYPAPSCVGLDNGTWHFEGKSCGLLSLPSSMADDGGTNAISRSAEGHADAVGVQFARSNGQQAGELSDNAEKTSHNDPYSKQPVKDEASHHAHVDADQSLMVATLRGGLTAEVSQPAEPEAMSPDDLRPGHVGSDPALCHPFLHADGRAVDLHVSIHDSITFRIESLRVFLEEQLGIKEFLAVYRYLQVTAQPDNVDGERQQPLEEQQPLELFVSAEAIEFLPLVHQLLVCEDQCFS